MSFTDARRLPGGTELSTDVCVVGAGAAGITLATELERTGRDVVLLESGGWRPEEETQALCDLESVGYPVREEFMSRARYYGGSCNLWAGRSMILREEDVAAREWVAGSGWPIPYAELERWYPAAAAALGLPPIETFDPLRHAPAMSEPERALFRHEALTPTVSLWARRPMRFGAAHRGRLRRSRRVRVLVYGNAVHLALDAGGRRVESVAVAPPGGHRVAVRARTVILACGGQENARLLLASRDRHERGIGNAHDLVGRCFMDHPRAIYGRVQLRDDCRLSALRGRPLPDGRVQIGIGTTPERQRREGLLNHYATLEAEVSQYAEARYQSFVQTMKILLRRGYAGSRWKVGRAGLGQIPGMIYLLTPKELVPHFVYRGYALARDALGAQPKGGTRRVVYFCEQPPDPESRVTLSRERDAAGVPRLVLDWRIGPAVVAGVRRLEELLDAAVRAAGIGELERGEGEPRFTDASHHMGTTRMGATPRTGVVDPEGRVHGVDNLYVAGSSVFPSAGHANPTLTIVALALRLAARLAGV